MGRPRTSAVAMTALLVISWVFGLQVLLLPTTPVAAILYRGVRIFATPIIKQLAKDYLNKKRKEGVTDLRNKSKDKNDSDNGGELDYWIKRAEEGVEDLLGKSNDKDERDKGGELRSPAAEGVALVVFSLNVGTPTKQNISFVLDITYIGVWAQSVPCTGPSCLTSHVFRPSNQSTTFYPLPCRHSICLLVAGPDPDPYPCNVSATSCEYNSVDDDGTVYSSGFLATDRFTTGHPDMSFDMVFGCSRTSDLDFSGSGASGVIGFAGGSSSLSLVSQLQIPKFSYLLSAGDSNGSQSIIRLGGEAVPKTKRHGSTPLLTSDMYPELYYVSLTGIKLDGKDLTDIPAGALDLGPNGTGGVYLSTTLPATYLNVAAYSPLRRALVSKIQDQGVSPVNGDEDLFHLCYMTVDFNKVKDPKLSLVFNGAVMDLTPDNYFFAADGETCLSILPSSDVSILGSLLQTGTNMIYDLPANTLTFEKAAEPVGAGAAPAPSRVSFIILAAPLVLVSWVVLLL